MVVANWIENVCRSVSRRVAVRVEIAWGSRPATRRSGSRAERQLVRHLSLEHYISTFSISLSFISAPQCIGVLHFHFKDDPFIGLFNIQSNSFFLFHLEIHLTHQKANKNKRQVENKNDRKEAADPGVKIYAEHVVSYGHPKRFSLGPNRISVFRSLVSF